MSSFRERQDPTTQTRPSIHLALASHESPPELHPPSPSLRSALDFSQPRNITQTSTLQDRRAAPPKHLLSKTGRVMDYQDAQHVRDLRNIALLMRDGTYNGQPPHIRPRGGVALQYWNNLVVAFGRSWYRDVVAGAPSIPAPNMRPAAPPALPFAQPGQLDFARGQAAFPPPSRAPLFASRPFAYQLQAAPNRRPSARPELRPRGQLLGQVYFHQQNGPSSPAAPQQPTHGQRDSPSHPPASNQQLNNSSTLGLSLLNSAAPPPTANRLPLSAEDVQRRLRQEHGIPTSHVAGENTTQYPRLGWPTTRQMPDYVSANPFFQEHTRQQADGSRGLCIPAAVQDSWNRHNAQWQAAEPIQQERARQPASLSTEELQEIGRAIPPRPLFEMAVPWTRTFERDPAPQGLGRVRPVSFEEMLGVPQEQTIQQGTGRAVVERDVRRVGPITGGVRLELESGGERTRPQRRNNVHVVAREQDADVAMGGMDNEEPQRRSTEEPEDASTSALPAQDDQADNMPESQVFGRLRPAVLEMERQVQEQQAHFWNPAHQAQREERRDPFSREYDTTSMLNTGDDEDAEEEQDIDEDMDDTSESSLEGEEEESMWEI